MKKPFFGLLALYVMLCIYGIIFSWFLYVGPIISKKVTKSIKLSQQRIVISLTTTPHRIDKIKDTLDSLVNQSVKADRIYVNVPYTFKRENISYTIPQWLQDYPGITINRTEDYGPITKLLPTLEQETDPNTLIITVDDDVWYPRQVVRDLVHYALQHPNAAVTPLNIHFDLNKYYQFTNIEYKFKHAAKTSLVVGSAGVAYRRKFFNPDFNNFFNNLPAACFLSDDLVISMYLAYNNINIEQTIKHSLHPLVVPFTYKELPYKSSPDALSFGTGEFSGNQIRYSLCLAELRDSANSKYQLAFLKNSDPSCFDATCAKVSFLATKAQ